MTGSALVRRDVGFGWLWRHGPVCGRASAAGFLDA